MADIRQSTQAYEGWLRQQLGKEVVEDDLTEKHEKMQEGPFAFLRATYWRWAETVLEVCPDAASAPPVLAIGDIHLENFGTWRDADGRLVWGVNDFDEAAEMPYVLDLMRLAASALIADGKGTAKAKQVCTDLLDGYRAGLAKPCPVVLDRDFELLRALVAVSDKKRAKFWKKMDAAKSEPAPQRYRQALAASMPDASLAITTFRRSAGAGSLGRPRWVGRADWQGGPVVREAKALMLSAWTRAHGRGTAAGPVRCGDLANGRYRGIDPWYRIVMPEGIVVRRLSPNNRKIEAEDDVEALLSRPMLQAMGLELANTHLGVADARAAIEKDLPRRDGGWLAENVEKMAAVIRREQAEWAAAQKETAKRP
jgi:Uncharacterized protein conserved in bacteria (DUF2252)